MISEHALASLREYVAKAFKPGTKTFPYYTLHGAEHLEELDRLALLVGGAIPTLSKERLDLLRLAIIVHDFAMMDLPDQDREAYLRQQMNPDTPLDELVRKTHQDEIERCFTQPDRLALLHGLQLTPHILEDAFTIAKHHRLHPLDQAPEHLQDLCSLMRAIDELDIGDKRAPLPAYEALRTQMDEVARFHWLKHICTRAVDAHATFLVEERNQRRILKIFVAVMATEGTWQLLQEKVLSKLKECIEGEGVNNILRSLLRVELEVAPALQLSKASSFLAASVKQDLEGLPESLLRPKTSSPPSYMPPPLPKIPANPVIREKKGRSGREFKIVAIPPESLAETLCVSGRLTVIGNVYVEPEIITVGGPVGAPNRIYVGPADSGKTRAALEWVRRLTGESASQWVVFRTGMGTLPENIEDIVIDTSDYEEHFVPQKAVLFLDDLPANLPAPSTPFSATDAVSTLFRWFHELPYVRERRVVGTLRLEDTHTRPDWPGVLPTLGQPLELVRIQPLSEMDYQKLWTGMSSGSISRSVTQGLSPFQIEMSEGFLDLVAQRPAEPEAVAIFVQQQALKAQTKLKPADAKKFSESAVATWLSETWPALRDTYGVAVRVFLSLARFLEAGLRPESGFMASAGPQWSFHESFGPEICALAGGAAESYLPILDKLILDGHASGKRGEWIRPRLDFLLHSTRLSEVELDVPTMKWFEERSARVSPSDRQLLAMHYAMSNSPYEESASRDGHWLVGLGVGAGSRAEIASDGEEKLRLLIIASKLLERSVAETPDNRNGWLFLGIVLEYRSDQAKDETLRQDLRNQAIDAYRRATDADPNYAQAWYNLGVGLGQQADQQTDETLRQDLRNQAIDAYRRATDADPNYAQAWNNLGVGLGQQADQQTDETLRQDLRNRAIDAYRRATDADPNYAQAWYNLGVRLGQQADQQTDETLRQDLRNQEIDAYRRATDADPNYAQAWYNLGVRLGQQADQQTDETLRQDLRNQEIDAYRRATDADPNYAQAWYNLGVRLGQQADQQTDETLRQDLRNQAIDAYRRATDADPNYAQAWNNLGVGLGQQADQQTDETLRQDLRNQEIDAYRRATDADPNYAQAWNNLGFRLGQQADQQTDETLRQDLRNQEIDAYRRATDADPNYAQAWNNLGVRLGQQADQQTDETLRQDLRNQAIDAYRRATDADPNNAQAWDNLAGGLLQQGHATGQPEFWKEALEAARKTVSLGKSRYNLACALTLTGSTEEALYELPRLPSSR